ncbi:PAS domain S-box-containing protein [Pseudonocardia thermophila]|uniref:histidine kinase n=1 Tax=Pseudonocardia thermophila TaxID=1848 RepID=A0A1M6WUY0_PSETH|nr:ATP-binding protein [Pseudonocardia thermophila]SHK97355.1 PAS domain S-box-containing protein [Pseudonocardia thermophila]
MTPRSGTTRVRSPELHGDTIFWSLPVAHAIVRVPPAGPDGGAVIEQANRALCDLVGTTPDELVGSTLEEVVAHETTATTASALLRAGAGRLGWPALLRRPRGAEGLRVEIKATELDELPDGDREFVVSVLPGPQRWSRPDAPNPSHLHDIVEKSPALIYIKDTQRRFVYANEYFAQHFGASAASLIGQTNDVVFPPEMARAFDENDALVFSTGRAHEFEEPAVGPHGAYRSVKFPLFDGEGRVVAVAGISTEITDLKRAQASARAARDRAEKASQAKSELLSRMSHELRTPLNAIIGFGQLLQRRALPGDAQQAVSRILDASSLLLTFINELLDQARIEAGHIDIQLEVVHAVAPVASAVELLSPLAGRHGIELAVDLHAGLYQFVEADPRRLKQVLINLITNGIKYNRRNGRVDVRFAEVDVATLRILISDTGPGLDPDDLDKLFLPFTRLAAAEVGTEGTGLGLALSKRLVEAMGGTIGVLPQDGTGSTFYIDLPRREATPEAVASVLADDAPEDPDELPEFPAPTRVLYVENDDTNVELVQKILALRREIELAVAGTGESGVARARAIRPDVVLLDLHLPDMSGEQVLAALRADPRTAAVPVAVFSADATDARIRQIRCAGADDYITKPVAVLELLRRVHALTTGRTHDG